MSALKISKFLPQWPRVTWKQIQCIYRLWIFSLHLQLYFNKDTRLQTSAFLEVFEQGTLNWLLHALVHLKMPLRRH